MRYFKILFINILILYCFSLFSQGIEFFEGSFNDALALAKQQNKIVFIDCYTKWCGPCKRLQSMVFTNNEAGDFYNKNFINFKIDMESQAGLEFGVTYPVRAYPTLFYISPIGKVVYNHVGGTDVQGLIGYGKNAIAEFDKIGDLENEWSKGNRDYDFVLKYIKSLNNANKSTLKTANEYLSSKPEISADQKAVFIYEATSECDSKLFDMMISNEYMKSIKKIYAEKEISNKIYASCWRTVLKSYDFDTPTLREEAKDKIKKYAKDRYGEFSKKIELYNSEITGELPKYKSASINYLEEIKDTDQKIDFIENSGRNFSDQKEILALKLELSKKAFEQEKNSKAITYYIRNLIQNKKNEEAIDLFPKAKKMAKDANDTESINALQRFELVLQNSSKTGN